jgi:hypothetical protein
VFEMAAPIQSPAKCEVRSVYGKYLAFGGTNLNILVQTNKTLFMFYLTPLPVVYVIPHPATGWQ